MLAEAIALGSSHFIGAMVPVLVECFKEAKENVDRDINNEVRNLKKACEEVEGDSNITISDRLNSEIIRLSNKSNTSRRFYTAGARETAKWINYAIYYITNPEAELIAASPVDKELVNGVSDYIGYGIIFDGYKPVNLHKYNACELEPGYMGDHLLMIEDIDDKIRDEDFMDKWKSVKHKRITGLDLTKKLLEGPVTTGGVTGRVDENGLIHPIFFEQPGYTQPLFNDGTVSQHDINFYEEALKNVLPEDCYHYFRKDVDGNITINIERDSEFHNIDVYTLDNGRIMGGTRALVLANYMNPEGMPDTVFVDVERYPDIAKMVFDKKFYFLDKPQVIQIMHDGFDNGTIYRHIDMSNTPWMNNISNLNLGILERRLNAVLKVLNKDIRLRFKRYVSPDEFTLISDSNVVSPLASLGVTSTGIEEGLSFVISGDSFKKFQGEQLLCNYNIESRTDA